MENSVTHQLTRCARYAWITYIFILLVVAHHSVMILFDVFHVWLIVWSNSCFEFKAIGIACSENDVGKNMHLQLTVWKKNFMWGFSTVWKKVLYVRVFHSLKKELCKSVFSVFLLSVFTQCFIKIWWSVILIKWMICSTLS